MSRLTPILLFAVLLLAGCGGRFSDSGWNPLKWRGGGSQQESLAPKEGYAQTADQRMGIPQIVSAKWEPLTEGRLLVVTGLTPSKGYSNAALVTARPQPRGRLTPDADGVLRLRFVAVPPAPDTVAARLPANPAVDSVTVALAISNIQLAGIGSVEISGASNAVVLGR